MTDPLSLFPLALAAADGRIDGLEARQLVAAGLTLLQRAAPLVRALSGKRSGILLPDGPAMLVALAASDGRGALLLDPTSSPSGLAWQLSVANVGAVFTTTDLAPRLPVGVHVVLLDHAPRSAQLLIEGNHREIDLGSHVGLELEGSRDAEGLDEDCVVVYGAGSTSPITLSHRQLIAHARGATDDAITAMPASSALHFLARVAATLMVGGEVATG